MTIAITGGNGQLGSALCRIYGEKCTPLRFPDFDLADPQSIRHTLKSLRPEVVINTAAYTDVDMAEQEPNLCHQINATAVASLTEICRQLNCVLVQLSTDYVFELNSGTTAYSESDVPRMPSGVYAASKWYSEKHVAQWERHFIVRTSGLYSIGDSGLQRGRNFVDTILLLAAERDRLKVVSDQHCTPTYVPHLAEGIQSLIATRSYGTYHMTNSGATNWWQFACEVVRRAGLEVDIEAIRTDQYETCTPRPRFSVLSNKKFESVVGQPLPTWQDGLSDYFERLHIDSIQPSIKRSSLSTRLQHQEKGERASI